MQLACIFVTVGGASAHMGPVSSALYGEIETATIRTNVPSKLNNVAGAIVSMIPLGLIQRAALLAACALLCAQVLLAIHQVEHLGHVDESSCEICLAGNALGSSLASSPSAFPFVPAPATLEQASGYRPVPTRPFRVHHARAPPTPVRS